MEMWPNENIETLQRNIDSAVATNGNIQKLGQITPSPSIGTRRGICKKATVKITNAQTWSCDMLSLKSLYV